MAKRFDGVSSTERTLMRGVGVGGVIATDELRRAGAGPQGSKHTRSDTSRCNKEVTRLDAGRYRTSAPHHGRVAPPPVRWNCSQFRLAVPANRKLQGSMVGHFVAVDGFGSPSQQ